MENEGEELEGRADYLRQDAQTKLDEAREKLLEAKRDLENSTTTDAGALQRNPFGKTRASLKQMASELQSAQAPILPRATPPPEEVIDG